MNAHPLLFYGLCFLLGIASRLAFHPVYLVVAGVVAFLWRPRWTSGTVIGAAGFCYALFSVSLPTLPEEGVEGKGVFHPTSVAYSSSPFGRSLLLKGYLKAFHTPLATWNRVPCQIYLSPRHPHPPARSDLIVEGRLLPKTYPHYVLKAHRLEPKSGSFSFAEARFQWKEKISQQMDRLFSNKEVCSVLLSLVTGEMNDRVVALQFNRLGLLHLLGVSGFQFTLLARVLGSFFKRLLPYRASLFSLLFCLSAYAFSLGDSPPIQRAWIAVFLGTWARLGSLQTTPLNLLGAALLWQLLLEPMALFQLGFQFSFLCTAAIFIVYPLFQQLLKRWWRDRSFAELRELGGIDRVGHALVFFCREAVALNCALHIASLPLLLYHFHKFPLLSLAYNLFLPPALSLAYLLLLPSVALGLFSPLLALPLTYLTQTVTQAVLAVASYPPALFDLQWRVPYMTFGWAVLTTTFLLFLFYERGRLFHRFLRG